MSAAIAAIAAMAGGSYLLHTFSVLYTLIDK
jgi:hypothetical protein